MKGYSDETVERITKQVRKERAANGQCTSRMMSFRMDADVVAYLQKVTNKGRTVNDAVRRWMSLYGKD